MDLFWKNLVVNKRIRMYNVDYRECDSSIFSKLSGMELSHERLKSEQKWKRCLKLFGEKCHHPPAAFFHKFMT